MAANCLSGTRPYPNRQLKDRCSLIIEAVGKGGATERTCRWPAAGMLLIHHELPHSTVFVFLSILGGGISSYRTPLFRRFQPCVNDRGRYIERGGDSGPSLPAYQVGG